MKHGSFVRRFRFNSFFNKLIASYIILITLVIFLIGILFYNGTNYQVQEEVKNTAIGTLRQTIRSTELIMAELDRASIQMASNNYIYNFMNDQDVNSSNYAQNLMYLSSYIISLRASNNILHSVYIYSRIKDKVFSSEAAMMNASLYQDTDIMKEMLEQNRRTLWLGTRPFAIDAYAQGNEFRQNVISFFRSYPIDASERKGVIQLNIHESAFYNLLQDLFPDNKGMIMIIDEKGRIISHNNKKMLYTDLSQEKYVSKIMEGPPEGFLIDRMNGVQYAIFYSSPVNSNWKYIAAIPVNKFMSSANLLKYTVFLLCMIVLLIGGTIAIFLARMNYRPIKNFISLVRSDRAGVRESPEAKNIDEIKELSEVFNALYLRKNTLEDQVNHNLKKIRQKFIVDFMQGNTTEEDNSGEYRYYKEKYRYPYFLVLSFLAEKKMQQSLKELITTYFFDEMNEYIIEPIRLTANECFLLLNYWEVPRLEGMLTGKITGMQEKTGYTLTVTTGGAVTTFDEISISYNEAIEARKYRITMGNKQPIFYSQLSEKKDAVYYELFSYIDNMMETIKSLELEAVLEDMGPFFQAVKSNCIPYDFIQQLYVQFYSRIFSFLKENGIYSEDFMVKEKNVYQKFKQFYDIEEIEKDIIASIDHAIRMVEEKRNGNKYKNTIQKIKMMILQEVENTELSLQYLADRADLSVSFLSKVFKEETGENFIDYIIRVRMEKAKKLLEDCNIPIGKVCEKAGYANMHSFIRTFKKYTGFTPGAFREKTIAEKLNALEASEDFDTSINDRSS